VLLQLGLAGRHQRENAALAVQLCRLWSARTRVTLCEDAAAQERVRLLRIIALHAPERTPRQALAANMLPAAYLAGLAATRWPGRAEVVRDTPQLVGDEPWADNLLFHLDGAHPGESAAVCAEWFSETASAEGLRVLMFNCMREREPARLLSPLTSHGAALAVGVRPSWRSHTASGRPPLPPRNVCSAGCHVSPGQG
jgi:folylpolyglutamate synthase